MRTARACALLLLLTGCRGSDGGDAAAADAANTPAVVDDGSATPTEAAPQRASPSGEDPFAGIEQLRPQAWAAWPLENVDPIGFDGWRIDATTGKFARDHGLVFSSAAGAFVLAIADGDVVEARRDADDRLELAIDHGHGIVSHYAPLSDALVHAHLPVTRGAAIGLAAGTSLRLRVTIDGLDVDPLLILRQPIHTWGL